MKVIESAEQFFASSGAMPTVFHDQRRFPRFYFRSCADATIYPLVPGADPIKCVVVTRDVSRGGMGLLHTEQLFPGQRIDLVLNGSVGKSLEVVWCRRVAEKSYSVGCRFKEGERAVEEGEG
jgi:PilZ domain